jgi:small-conductance mechanosensitive channel
MNGILRDFVSVILTIRGVFAVNARNRFFFKKREREYHRLHHSRVLLTLVVGILGRFLIFMVIFGVPSQTSTMIGLVTAGITIALKDFIVSFLGWIVLMGREGIRVGDWVEIDVACAAKSSR